MSNAPRAWPAQLKGAMELPGAAHAILGDRAAMYYVYILKCSDNSYYTGMTHDLAKRLAEHSAGTCGGYTSARLPVTLVWSESVQNEHDALLCERQIKGWSRAKKEALIHEGFASVHALVAAGRGHRKAIRRQSSTSNV